MLFLFFNNADAQFSAKKRTWRSYTAVEVLPITNRVELIDKKAFANIALNNNS